MADCVAGFAVGSDAGPKPSCWKSRSTFTNGLLARSTEAQPLNLPPSSDPDRPLMRSICPLMRTSALAVRERVSTPGASSVNSVGMFCRPGAPAGNAALMVNFREWLPGRALPAIAMFRSASILMVASRSLIRSSTRLSGSKNTIAPLETVTRSTGKDVVRAGASSARPGPEGAFVRARSRSIGSRSVGWSMVSSETFGEPDSRLDNGRSARTSPTVR